LTPCVFQDGLLFTDEWHLTYQQTMIVKHNQFANSELKTMEKRLTTPH